MSEVLELAQLPKNQRVTEVKIRARGIDPQLHAQRAAECELFTQLRLADDLGRTLFEKRESFVRLHGHRARIQKAARYLFLFNSSRTCSIVSGRLCAASAFWLLPRSRNGRLPAKVEPWTLLSLPEATRMSGVELVE